MVLPLLAQVVSKVTAARHRRLSICRTWFAGDSIPRDGCLTAHGLRTIAISLNGNDSWRFKNRK
jgi:hypothetical protein